MWDISEDKQVFDDLAMIDGEREDLLYYDVPILFTGRNSQGKTIIGSFIDIDETQDTENYLHAVINQQTFDLFNTGSISYPEALRQAIQLYAVSWFDAAKKPRIFALTFNDIPQAYRPKEEAFMLPAVNVEAVSIADKSSDSVLSVAMPTHTVGRADGRYAASLRDGLADRHRATPEDVLDAHAALSRLIKGPLDLLGRTYNLITQIYAVPDTAGSFNVSYEVEIWPNLFISGAGSIEFLDSFLSYLLSNYPGEAAALISSQFESVKYFNDLLSLLESVGSSPQNEKTKVELRDELAREVCESTQAIYAIAKGIGANYQRFAILNNTHGDSAQLGEVSSHYKEQIEVTLRLINDAESEPVEVLLPDLHDRTYKLTVYDFNKRTGNGKAYVREVEEQGEEMPDSDLPWASLKVRNFRKKGQVFKYTQSLHEGTYITVIGKAKRRLDGTIAEIVINE